MPCGGPNLGKIAHVISAALRDVLRSLCNVLIPHAEPQRGSWPHRWPWFPMTKSLQNGAKMGDMIF